MSHDLDDEDALAGIDLHVWRVPPPAPVDRASLVMRALLPAVAPARRRIGWLLAAIVLLNATIATLIVIFVARSPATEATVVALPAGDGSVDARVHDLLQRLDDEQREIERKLAEIAELRALVIELSEKIRHYEQDEKRKVPHAPPVPDRQHVDPFAEPDDGRCDEVSCVLQNYEGTCCKKFQRPRPPAKPPATTSVPDALDRLSIVTGLAPVKPLVAACAERSKAKGAVKVRVLVDPSGVVTNVVIEATPDDALGACIEPIVRRAVFPRTKLGGSFAYPFVF
jgi:hypothetical protein